MKKLIALFMALAMLCTACVCFAEEEAVESGVDVAADEILNFDITMDKLPEGYTMEKINLPGVLGFVMTGGEDDPMVFGSVAFSEEFAGYTLDVAALSEEEQAQMIEMLAGDYNNATITYSKTAYGTDLIILAENDAESDVVEIMTIYQGYFVTIALMNNAEITEAQVEMGVQILSDLWIVAQ